MPKKLTLPQWMLLVEVSDNGKAWIKGAQKRVAKILMARGLAAYESRLSIVSTEKGKAFVKSGPWERVGNAFRRKGFPNGAQKGDA